MLNKRLLDQAKRKYSDARKAIDCWVFLMETIQPVSFFELKQVFPAVDLVGENEVLVCFDIKGNHYRLVAKMNYPVSTLVKDFDKHSEYERKYKFKRRKR
ncbi:MAG: type II toxin-antitoxin system HigB family toxin [Spirochaetales bacterium]|nr:type II toxin-antitoxin system HigB family toxin [Spirochaetales bacterium]